MEKIKFIVNDEYARQRLDKFLVDVLRKKFSRSFIKKLIDGGHVLVNQKNSNAHHKISTDDAIEVSIPDAEALELKPEKILLDVVYEDSDLIVVNKPVGLAVHPAGGSFTGTLVNGLLFHCEDLSGIGGVMRPGIVHRLDKDTSGLLVVAKNDAAHIDLSNQFRHRIVKRTYIALVKGIVQLDNERIELPIARRSRDVTKMGISFTRPDKKNAITHYKVLKRFKNFTMLKIKLETGRTHQIRVHMSYLGHPILGDKVYGQSKGLNRQALHAKTLGFFHPTKKEFMEFTSGLPDDMQALINRGRI